MKTQAPNTLSPIFQDWWSSLTDAEHDGRNADRAGLAQLRRIGRVSAEGSAEPDLAVALTVNAFRALYKRIGARTDRAEHPDWDLDLVIAATALAHVREHKQGQTTASLLWGADLQTPLMAESRFKRLIRSDSAGDLFDQARRLVALLKDKAPVGELGASLFLWRTQPKIRRDWARAYYRLDRSGEAATPANSILPSTGVL
jgi:CRISPR system Cascade subunit CasB